MSNACGSPYDQIGTVLQRLFSTFPNSWPGVGLTLIRICVTLALFSFAGSEHGSSNRDWLDAAQQWCALAGGMLLLAGLWTPAVAILVALNEVGIALSVSHATREGWCSHMFLAGIALSLAMLGPGAWSLDARLFGRKRIDIDRTGGMRSSR